VEFVVPALGTSCRAVGDDACDDVARVALDTREAMAPHVRMVTVRMVGFFLVVTRLSFLGVTVSRYLAGKGGPFYFR
jgi:hypothetical protein